MHAQTLLSCSRCYDEHCQMLPFITNAMHSLWSDRGIKMAVTRGHEYDLNDSAH